MNKYILGLIVILSLALAYFLFLKTDVKHKNASNNVQIGGDFALIDTNNKIVTRDSLKDKITLLFFGFTHCPMICPTALGTLSAFYDKLDDKEKNKINIIFITLDPERDSSNHLKEYITNFKTPIIALTGNKEQIENIARNYKIYYEKINLENNDYTINHSTLIYLMDKNHKYFSHFPYDINSDEIYKVIRDLI
jgi:protein SCO1/2